MVKIADLPVRVVKNKLIVDGTINGQKIGIVLDTGATTDADAASTRRTGWGWSGAKPEAIGYSAWVERPKPNRC